MESESQALARGRLLERLPGPLPLLPFPLEGLCYGLSDGQCGYYGKPSAENGNESHARLSS